MRRSVLAAVLAALMTLSLTACGGDNTAGGNNGGENAGGAGAVEIPPVEDLTDVDTSGIPTGS